MVKQTAAKLLKGDVKGVAEDITETFKRTIGLYNSLRLHDSPE